MIGSQNPAPEKARIERDAFWPAARLSVDPFRLPVRFELPGRTAFERVVGIRHAITLYPDHMVVWRNSPFVRHAPRVVPMDEFSAVVLDGGYTSRGEFRMAVRLESERHGLSVPVHVVDSTDELAAVWQAWGRSLRLPVRIRGGDGVLREPGHSMGGVALGPAMPRRPASDEARRRGQAAATGRRRMPAFSAPQPA